MLRLGIISLICLIAQLATAASLNNCKDLNDVDYVVEPWDQATRTFSEGKVRVIHVDTMGEPACCSSHMLILMEDPNAELGERKCIALSQSKEGTGFYGLDVMAIQSTETSGKLSLEVPVRFYSEDGEGTAGKVKLTLDTAKAKASVEK